MEGDSDSQFKESIGDLEHENVGMTVVMNDEDAFYRSSHAVVFIIVL